MSDQSRTGLRRNVRLARTRRSVTLARLKQTKKAMRSNNTPDTGTNIIGGLLLFTAASLAVKNPTEVKR